MYRIYSITEGIPAELRCGIFACTNTYEFVDSPALADFLAYPTHYQVAYDYTAADFQLHGLSDAIQLLIRQRFSVLEALATLHGKRIISFYIRSDHRPLPFKESIVFRTSLTASGRRANEFAFPANGRPLQMDGLSTAGTYAAWKKKPEVGFRGQAAPLNLPFVLSAKNGIKLALQRFGLNTQLAIKYNFGYLHRRNAIIYLAKNDGINLDYAITKPEDIYSVQARAEYTGNLLNNAYALCVSGHGNYSFRLYETMAAARVPLFVNTDCVQALKERIDYKSLFVWVESTEIHRVAEKLIEFNNKHSGDAFASLQQKIWQEWSDQFAGNNFYRQLPFYLRHFAN